MYTHQQKSTIQKILDDNSQLILLIIDLQSKGKHYECLEHQKTLYRNLTYLTPFDSFTSHHPNNLPLPNASIQNQPPSINGNFIQQNQSDQIYRIQTNNSSSNILNQTLQNNNNNNSYSSSNLTNVLNNPSISQQRSSYLQQGRILNNQSIEQQNVYEQYSSQQNSSSNTQNLISHPNTSDQQIYYPQQNSLQQQQWQNQSRISSPFYQS